MTFGIMMIMMLEIVIVTMMIPILVTLVGIVTDVSAVHCKNTYSSNRRNRVSKSR